MLDRAQRVIPGASVAAFHLPDDLNFVVARGEGAQVWSTDGRPYVDYLLGSGPLVLGHAHPRVVEAVREQAALGTTYHHLSEPAIRLAEKVTALVPCAEAVKFAGSGTEATFYALRLARAFTGREAVLKFDGGYHGAHDYGQQGLAGPESAGIPAAVAETVLVAPFNDLERTLELAEANARRLAAIVVEPVQRAIEPRPGFLQGLRQICDRTGALLVFDEVVTGFRLALGGAQERYGVRPDLCALAKALGGGLPLAAVAGRRDVLEASVPAGGRLPAYLGGTLNGNPLAAAAGLATLQVLEEESGPARLAATGMLLDGGFRDLGRRLSVPLQVIGPPAIGEPLFGEGEVHDLASYNATNRPAAVAFGEELLRRGIFCRPGFKLYVSTAHTPAHLDQTLEVAEEAVRAVRDRGLLPS